jgi:hypothetical protein
MMESFGTLEYDPIFYTARLLVDPELVRYLFSTLPKYSDFIPQKHDPHITVVRSLEYVPNRSAWFSRAGEKIRFIYQEGIVVNEKYAWVDCDSHELRDIRRGLGMQSTRFLDSAFHITIGNRKDQAKRATRRPSVWCR